MDATEILQAFLTSKHYGKRKRNQHICKLSNSMVTLENIILYVIQIMTNSQLKSDDHLKRIEANRRT